MCKYCRERGKREYILNHISTLKIKKIKVLKYTLQINNTTYVKINFCPMCR